MSNRIYRPWLDKAFGIATALAVTYAWFFLLAPVFWRQGSSAAFNTTVVISIADLVFLLWTVLRTPKPRKVVKQ